MGQQYADRHAWSKEIEHLLREAGSDTPSTGAVRHDVLAPAQGYLEHIAEVLRDDDAEIGDSALGDVQALLGDRHGSPLFGDDPEALRASAAALAARIERGR
jgi:hypothetical protein